MRQVGWICAAAQGIEVKDRGQVPAERVVKFKRRPERRCVGRLSGFGLQHALMHDVSMLLLSQLGAALYLAGLSLAGVRSVAALADCR